MYCTRKQWDLQGVRTDVVQTPRTAHETQARFERSIALEGALSDEQMAKLLVIANRCPVHLALEAGAQIGTRLKGVPAAEGRAP
jgi:uncharacterized OsmC-like protein